MDIFRINLPQTPQERDSGSAGWPIPFWCLCLDLRRHPRSDEALPPPALNLYHSGKKEKKKRPVKLNVSKQDFVKMNIVMQMRVCQRCHPVARQTYHSLKLFCIVAFLLQLLSYTFQFVLQNTQITSTFKSNTTLTILSVLLFKSVPEALDTEFQSL